MALKLGFHFHRQFTEVDCFPTSVLNGLGYLFHRSHIPAAVVRQVYMAALDGITVQEKTGRYTSEAAAQYLASWLPTYRTKRFAVEAEYLTGAQVHLGANNPIARCLNSKGVAICDVAASKLASHTVLILAMDREWVRLWDPYHIRVNGKYFPNVEALNEGPEAPNLQIRRAHLDLASSRKFTLGPHNRRSCTLLWRRRG